jgi:hypothetical protein
MLLLACTDEPGSAPPPGGPSPDADTPDAVIPGPGPAPTSSRPLEPAPTPRTYAPTYTAVWDEIFLPSCAWLYCHGGNGLLLVMDSKQRAYESLMEPAAGAVCRDTGLRRIEPGEPDRSLAVLKLGDPPPCGDRMPITLVATPLSGADIDQLRAWVERGAPDD